ncbi:MULTISPECIES: KUP/HAK/KT family potassium transporter [Aeromonas]|uniref:KUP/HAK/KT family potassium transporter n=1 Tax=Aeromonas TaxID=642 RepID=UPI001F09408D|nr:MULTISPECIES: KUP/HAK/KT family potassium transporter [Aeromonas]
MNNEAGQGRMTLTLAAFGVLYSDIGTSPLYALKQSFARNMGLQPGKEEIYAIVSLFFWSIMLVVSLKYVLLVLKADNKAMSQLRVAWGAPAPPASNVG